LDFIIKGNLIKMDIFKILLDYEDEESLMKDIGVVDMHNHLRYEVINCSFCLVANCATNASWLKASLGQKAYTI
jgi:hypothetical protein